MQNSVCLVLKLQKYLEEYLNGLLDNVFCRNDHSMVITLTHTHTQHGNHFNENLGSNLEQSVHFLSLCVFTSAGVPFCRSSVFCH